MTDFADSCFRCGGHLRRNVYSGTLCPECEVRFERGEITMLGDTIEPTAVPYTRFSIRTFPDGSAQVAA